MTGQSAHSIRDASGAVIARDIGFVRGVVDFNGRSYFEVPLKTPGASYRVSVTALEGGLRGAGPVARYGGRGAA